MTYRPPLIELVPAPKPARHQLVLVTRKGELPTAVAKAVPSHLSEHPALKGERGAKLALHGATSTLVLGLGPARDFSEQEAAEWGENAGHWLIQEKLAEAQVVPAPEVSDAQVWVNFAKGLALANLRLDELKSKSDERRTELKKLEWVNAGKARLERAQLERIAAIVRGIAFARTIIELPADMADPQGVVDRFQAAAGASPEGKQLEVEVWDEKRIAKEGMGLLAAVSRGSHVPPRLLVVRYGRSMRKKPALHLVGKGVTFDTGGVNLKTGMPWKDLLSMKKDMGGAGAVLGTALALATTKPSLQVTVITPLTTNAIDGRSVIPGDVVRSYSGKTVEIQNTDAEGRLILADALHLSKTLKADYVVDVATLTGACAVALGSNHSGLYSNHERLAGVVLKASSRAGEPAWRMPVTARYGEELKSNVADLSNMGKTREGGASVAAAFLEKFVDKTPWAHLDIAGTVDLGEPAAGAAQLKAAGRMVHTLVELAHELAQ